MTILGVDHVEFSVGDARQTASWLCGAFGFQILGRGGPGTGQPGQRSFLLGQGDARVLLTSGLSARHPAADYVARHGDGVCAVAFATDDVTAAFADAVAAGATPIAAPAIHHGNGGESVTVAAVSGFGDVLHRLVERRGPDRMFLPGTVDTLDREPSGSTGIVYAVDHIAVCVPFGELDSTTLFYEKAFGFQVIFEEYIEVGLQGMASKVVQSPSGGVTFTLIEPDLSRRPGQIDDFLAWHDGAGVQHVALSTTDIVVAVSTLAGRGVEFARTPASYYAMLAGRTGPADLPVEQLAPLGILVDRDHWGEMYQIFAKSTHIRRTFFWELIERHGARTFGTSNIPALYAAKERELAAFRETTETGLS
jgi:4-hydroxymandelate synthase